MKKLFLLCSIVLTALLLIISAAGCQQQPEPVTPSKGPTTLAIMVESNTVEAGSSFMVSGSNFKPEELVFAEFEYRFSNGRAGCVAHDDADEQGLIHIIPGNHDGNIQNFVSDGIILHPTSSTALIPMTKRALEAGIHVTTEHCPLKGGVSECHVWEATPQAGWLMGAILTLAIDGKGKIVALPGPPGQEEAARLWKGFTDYIANFPEVKVVGVEWANPDIGTALRITENFLTAHPDVDGIYTWFEIEAQGAIRALKARGYKPGQVKIITAWVSEATLKLVKEGWVQYVLPGSAVEVGRTSVRIMKRLIEGEGVPKEVSVPMFVVDKDTIDKWDRSKWRSPK